METAYMAMGSAQWALLLIAAIALWRGLRRVK